MPGSRYDFNGAAAHYLARCVRVDGCLVNPNLRPTGYGVLHYREGGELRRMTAHRAIFAHYNGPIPSGMVVRHRCDNPPCVAREHLHLGTQGDNVRDIHERGRRTWENSRRGERHHSAVLTAELVAHLRIEVANGAELLSLARRLGLPYQSAHKAVRGKTWAWLTEPGPVAS